MSKVQYDSFLEMRKFFHSELLTLEEIVPIINPVSEDDKHAFALMLNMLRGIDERLQKATTLNEVSDLLDMEALEEPWHEQERVIAAMAKEAKHYIYSKVENDVEAG